MIMMNGWVVVEVIGVVEWVVDVIMSVEEPVEMIVGIIMISRVVIVPVRPVISCEIVLSSGIEFSKA
jgi:hypothetical protein